MELVSIVVPVYNVEHYLVRCLESLLNQTYQNIEVIAVNDGSTDDSLSILTAYQKQDQRLRFIDQVNQGLSMARNHGVALAKGEFVMFVDSDDYLHLDSLQALVDAFASDVDMVELPMYDVYSDQQIFSPYQTPSSLNDIELAHHKAGLLQIGVYACAKLFRKDLIASLPFPKGLMHEDNYVAVCLLPQLRKIKKLEVGGYYYYHRSHSITSAFSDNMYDMIEIQRKIHQYYQDHGLLVEYEWLLEKVAVRNLCVAILGKKMSLIREEFKDTRTEKYKEIKELMTTYYPAWRHNAFVTWKEKVFVSFLLSSAFHATVIWKGVSVLHGQHRI